MDLFEDAAQRLARDQSKLRARRQVAVSAKAQREAAFRKKQQERLRQERQAKQKLAAYQEKYMTSSDRSLKVRQLSSNGSCLQLQATSIWGEGDKIALPPSVLEYLTSSQTADSSTTGSPWMFRIGIRNPHYHFPQSILLRTMKPPNENDEDEEDDTMHEDDSDDDEMDGTFNSKKMHAAYLEELSHKYLAYTHGTVVEFTQDEGHVGLPAPIAAALLNSAGNKNGNNNHQDFQIPTKRTVDPSSSKITHSAEANDNNNNNNHNDMGMEEDEEKTPGHIAYGAFDVPDMPVEITLVKLPKGKGCTLTPTQEAIHNGFYNLRDIKLVLEQSLVRTRATLSVGDKVHTWHRGVKYDLVVTKVIPSQFQAVTSIDTDIEVEFGAVEEQQQQGGQQGNSNATTAAVAAANTNSLPLSSDTNFASAGRTLASSSSSSPSSNDEKKPSSSLATTVSLDQLLRPEPSADQKQGVCTIQIKADAATGRRRFDVTKSSLQDLFQFASHVSQLDAAQFRLVTRFPRRVISLEHGTSVTSLADAGIQAGQELLMVERM